MLGQCCQQSSAGNVVVEGSGSERCLGAALPYLHRSGVLLPDPIPLLHLKCIDAAASRDCSSCKVFLKPLCNLSFAGNVDKAFCCLFFDPRAQYCRRFQTSPDPEVFICKAEQVGDRRQVLPNMLKIDALRWYNILLVCAFI